MLDSTTKQRINSCRDILVGKVPDPKAQVEQITTALIYKFMDDMDAEAEEIGGKAAFLIGKLKEFRWNKLMSKQLTGHDRMDLYVRAIAAFAKAESLPKFFRDVFAGYFLPYRDSETLNLFLKEIDEFHYDHSEKLGDAYEYLLSILGSQGDAGQFRTPRHIIEFIVDCVDPDIGDTILDPACGTAGFLISAYKHIIEKYDGIGDDGKLTTERRLTKSERASLINNITGYDISPDMVRISKVNMYLHKFPEPNIYEYDSLTSEERWKDTFSIILANPPFMSPKGGVRPHSKFGIDANRTEVLFSDYIMEHLKPAGRAGFIVPEGIIFQSANAYKELRKRLIEDYGLFAVISLPAGVFQPYSGVKTSILLLDKSFVKTNSDLLFIKIENDGYDLGAQRRATPDKNDLPNALEYIRKYKINPPPPLEKGGSISKAPPLQGGVGVVLVPKSKIAASGDYNLSMDRYRETIVTGKQQWPMVKLGKICIINPTKNEIKLSDKTVVSFVPMSDVNENAMDFLPLQERVISEVNRGYTYFADNDVLIAKVTPCFENGKAGIAKKLKNGIGFGTTELYVLRSDHNKLLPELLYYFVTSNEFRNAGEEQMTGTGGLQRVPKDFVCNYQIPLPPLPVQEALVAELERYRKMIEGARAIIANYKPEIEINPEWEMKELGEVCEVNPTKNEIKLSNTSEVSFVPMSDVNENTIYFVPQQEKIMSEVSKGYTYFKNDDVLVAKVTPCFENGKAGIAKNLKNGIGFGSTELYVVRPKAKTLLPEIIFYFLTTEKFRNEGKDRMTGTGGLQRVPKDFILNFNIPLPPLAEQSAIVARLESERSEIEMLKAMIVRLEGVIKEKVAAMW